MDYQENNFAIKELPLESLLESLEEDKGENSWFEISPEPDNGQFDDLEFIQEIKLSQVALVEEELKEKEADEESAIIVEQDKSSEASYPEQKEKNKKGLFSGISFWEGSRVIGLDIGTKFIKYVEFNRGPLGLVLRNYGCQAIEPEGEDINRTQQVIEAILKDKRIKSTRLLTAVSGLEVVFGYLRVPKMPKKELREAIRWACRKELPFSINSASIDYALLGEISEDGATKFEVATLAVHENRVNEHLALLKPLGITPAKVSAVPIALWSLVSESSLLKSDGCTVVVDIGASTSTMAFINGENLQFVREITTAGDDFTQALTGTIFFEGNHVSLSQSRAEEIKLQYGIPDENSQDQTEEGIPLKEISVMIRPVLERFVSEIQRSLDYFREKFSVNHIQKFYLCGGGARLKNLARNLSQELRLETEVLNPAALLSKHCKGIDKKLDDLAPALGISIGLALDKRKEFNLLPPELKGLCKFRFGKRILSYAAMLILMILVGLTGQILLQSKQFKNDLKRLKIEYQRLQPIRNKYLSLKKELEDLKTRKAIYARELDSPSLTAAHLKALSQLVPKNIALTSLSIKSNDESNPKLPRESIHLQGVVFSRAADSRNNNPMEGVSLAQFLLRLGDSGYFSNISLQSQEPIREGGGGLYFHIVCEPRIPYVINKDSG